MTCLVTLFDLKLKLLKNSPNWPFLAFLVNVNVARFARNVEWDFFYDFQTLCLLNPLKCETKQLKKYLLEKRNVLTEKTQDAKIHFLRIQFTIRKLVQKSFELVLQ